MQLWTVQTLDAWEEACRVGTLRASSRHIPPHFRGAYEWMARQMEKRLGAPPQGVEFPVWAWFQWQDARHRRPDLRCGGHLPPGTHGARVEFQVDSSQVLLSVFEEWHFVLNYWYLYPSVEEDEYEVQDIAFDKALAGAGLNYYTSKPLPDATLRRQLEESWQRIFRVPRHSAQLELAELPDSSLQATLWEVPTHRVRYVTYFRAR